MIQEALYSLSPKRGGIFAEFWAIMRLIEGRVPSLETRQCWSKLLVLAYGRSVWVNFRDLQTVLCVLRGLPGWRVGESLCVKIGASTQEELAALLHNIELSRKD